MNSMPHLESPHAMSQADDHQPKRRSQPSTTGLMALYAACTGLLLLFFFGVSAALRGLYERPLIIPDEKAVAARLLARQLTGPRYFEIPAGDMRDADGVVVPASTESHLTTQEAHKQVAR